MLVIRMQRTGRKGHAQFRVVVQDSRRTPTSGKIVAQLGTYDPHTKAININSEKAEFYLTHGAQPSPRATMLLKSEGVKLPDWVTKNDKKTSAVRHPEKLRRNQPKAEVVAETPAEEPAPAATEEVTAETPAEEVVAEPSTATEEAAPAA